jgi:predicted nucleic acid-binding protein
MAKNLAFFDSNVLISASISGHVHHAASHARLALLRRSGGACASHSLAEAYNTLTAYPKGYGIPAADASRILQQVSELYTLVSLTSKETLEAIENAALLGLTGGIVYDALLIACARKIDARVIYTNNVKHFRRIAPDLTSRIHEP